MSVNLPTPVKELVEPVYRPAHLPPNISMSNKYHIVNNAESINYLTEQLNELKEFKEKCIADNSVDNITDRLNQFETCQNEIMAKLDAILTNTSTMTSYLSGIMSNQQLILSNNKKHSEQILEQNGLIYDKLLEFDSSQADGVSEEIEEDVKEVIADEENDETEIIEEEAEIEEDE